MLAVGTKASHASSLADVLVEGDLRGHYSHGLNRMGVYENHVPLNTILCHLLYVSYYRKVDCFTYFACVLFLLYTGIMPTISISAFAKEQQLNALTHAYNYILCCGSVKPFSSPQFSSLTL